jgi:hypothetical protein
MDQRASIHYLEPQNPTKWSTTRQYNILHGIWIESSVTYRFSIQGTKVDVQEHNKSRTSRLEEIETLEEE